MNKMDRDKFSNLKIGDTIWYLDSGGCTCEAPVSGWINHEGLPAALVGQHGDKIVPLEKVLSRTRGSDHKEWPKLVQHSGA